MFVDNTFSTFKYCCGVRVCISDKPVCILYRFHMLLFVLTERLVHCQNHQSFPVVILHLVTRKLRKYSVGISMRSRCSKRKRWGWSYSNKEFFLHVMLYTRITVCNYKQLEISKTKSCVRNSKIRYFYLLSTNFIYLFTTES